MDPEIQKRLVSIDERLAVIERVLGIGLLQLSETRDAGHQPPGVNRAETGRAIVDAIQQFEKSSGKRWRR